ncbi:TrbI/VirB10 family protein [Lautropia mirabilis]
MSELDNMAPDDSPGSLSKKTGLRRVNRVPLLIVGALLLGFAVMIGLVAADRASQQSNQGKEQKQMEEPGNTSMFAKEIAGMQTDGFIPPDDAPTPPAIPKDPPVLVAKPPPTGPEDRDRPPLPPPNLHKSAYTPPSVDNEASRIRSARMRALEEAIKSPTGVQLASNASRPFGGSRDGASMDSADPQSEYMRQLAKAKKLAKSGAMGDRSGMALAGAGRSSRGADTDDEDPNTLSRFDSNDPDRWQLRSKPRKPGSPYELRAGFVIPAILISGINSELPGQIMAQVAQNVYDTPTGRYTLIPQGSRLVGTYASEIAFGQARAFVAWQRIVFPDGKAMDIGAMPGADGAGYAGFSDQVDNHYARLFGSAFLMSAVTAGVTLSQDRGYDSDRGRDRRSAGDVMSEELGRQLGTVMSQLIAKNMNISPTLEIRPGYRFNVIVTKDMTFKKPYESFDY